MARKGKSELPLDDYRHWLPLIMAHHLWSEKLVGTRLSPYASDELRKELRRGKLRCMRRQDTASEPGVVSRTFWRDHEIDISLGGLGLIQIYRGPQSPSGRDPSTRVDGLFFVWKPDVDQFWSTPEQEQPVHHKPGPQPTKNWKLHVAAELHRIVEAGKPVPPASYFADHCRDRLAYTPEIRAVQRLLKQLH
jgi:hypothetical protein